MLPSLVNVVPTAPPVQHSPIPMELNMKESEGVDLEKREQLLREQAAKVEFLAAQLERKEMENAQLRAWIEQGKPVIPTYQQTHDTLITPDGMTQNTPQLAQQLYQNSAAAGVQTTQQAVPQQL